MRWYVWLIISPFIILIIGVLILLILWELSPEGREYSEARRELERRAKQTRRQIYDEEVERVRAELHEKKQPPT